MIYLITIYCLLFSVLSWKRIHWALALVVFGLPTYLIRFTIGSIPFTLLEAMILVLFLVWLIKKVKSKESIQFSNYKWWALIFLVFSTFSIFISPDRIVALGIWKAYFIEPILFFIVFINVVKKREHWNLIVNALGLSALLVAIPAIIQKFTAWGISNPFWADESTRRVVSWYGFPNAVGLYLAPIVVLFVGLLVRALIGGLGKSSKVKGKSRGKELLTFLFYCFVVFLSMAAIVFAKSEGALIGIVVAVIFLGIFYPNKKLRIATVIVLVAVALLVTIVPPVRTYAVEKATMSDLSGQIRLQQWRETWEMLKDNKAFEGAGLSGYQTEVEPHHQEGIFFNFEKDPDFQRKVFLFDDKYKADHWQPTEIYMYPHNFFLNFWSEIGLLGMLAVVMLLIKFTLNYLRVKKPENREMYLILIAVMAAIVVHGLVDVQYFKNDLSVLWWLVFGMSTALMKNVKCKTTIKNKN